jgi:hypothetical protein
MMAIGSAKYSTVDYSFYMDSACSHRISSDLNLLFDYVELETSEVLETSKKGVFIELVGKRTLRYQLYGTLVEIKNVFDSPDTNANVFSNSVLDDKEAKTVIENDQITLSTSYNHVFMRGQRFGPLYLMDITPVTNSVVTKASFSSAAVKT